MQMKQGLLCGSVFLALLLLGCFMNFHGDGAAREARLNEVYATIQHPADAVCRSCRMGHKNQERWVDGVYRYAETPEQVAAYYAAELRREGWTPVRYDVGYGQPFYAYSKDELLLLTGLHKNNDWTVTLSYRDPKKTYVPLE